MGVKRKITKKVKANKRVEVVEVAGRWFDTLKERKKTIIIASIGILVIFLSTLTYQVYAKKREEKSHRLFMQAKSLYDKLDEGATKGSGDTKIADVIVKFQEIVDNYGETSTATLSLIYLGNLCYLTNEYQDAVNFYQSYLKNSSFDMRLDFIALKSMGQCYLAMGKIEEAERAFRELVNGEDVWPKKDGFKSLILVYEMENRVNEIRTIITQAFKDYPELQEDPFFMTKMGKYEVTQE